MRRVSFLTLAVIMLLLAPAFVSASGLFGIGLPWTSNLGGVLSGPSGCCDPGLKCCPSVYVGYEIGQSRDRKPFNFGSDFSAAPDGTYQLNTNFSEPGGLWLGVSNYCPLADRIGIMASGWYLFPSGGDAEETYGVGLQANGNGGGNRIWSTSRSWGWIDGAMVLGSQCGLNVIAGFRWDSYSVRLRNPTSANPPLLPRGTASDEADLTLNSYIPLIGTQDRCGGPCCGLLVRVVGFPWVPGNLRYGETGFLGAGSRLQINGNYDRAYFLEVFSEYSRNCGSLGCFGIFARWNYLDVRSHTNPEIVNPSIIIVDLNEEPRTSWTVGGKFTLNF